MFAMFAFCMTTIIHLHYLTIDTMIVFLCVTRWSMLLNVMQECLNEKKIVIKNMELYKLKILKILTILYDDEDIILIESRRHIIRKSHKLYIIYRYIYCNK